MGIHTGFGYSKSCDITVVPGGIWLSASGSSASDIMNSLRWNSWGTTRKNPLGNPIPIPELDRSITLTAKPLSRSHMQNINSFQTNYIGLLGFLSDEALSSDEQGNTCTTLFFDQDEGQLVAFCATKCSSLRIEGESITLCPSVEIAVLCVDDRYRYKGIGQGIIQHIQNSIANLRRSVGVQLISLFAIPDAVDFYIKCGFRKVGKGMKILKAPVHQSCSPMYFVLPKIDMESRELVNP